jgi:hypothetical protein
MRRVSFMIAEKPAAIIRLRSDIGWVVGPGAVAQKQRADTLRRFVDAMPVSFSHDRAPDVRPGRPDAARVKSLDFAGRQEFEILASASLRASRARTMRTSCEVLE